MRIANQTIIRNYTGTLNSNLNRLNQYNQRISSQRRFQSMYEDTSSGVRALQIRRTMSSIESQIDTAKTVKSTFTSAESQMLNIVDLGEAVAEKYTVALNATSTPDARKAIRNEISRYQEEILANANGQFSGSYMFGGTNSTERPFTVEDGKLHYNGVKVSDIDPNDEAYAYLFDDAVYVDIGLGFSSDANGELNTSTAFKRSLVGIDFIGCGEDNIYDLCSDIIAALDDPEFHDGPPFSDMLDKMHTAYNNISLEVTKLGADSNYLDYNIQRLEDDMINLQERQNTVESVDPAEAIMQFKMQDYVYNAALQMGQRLLQPSLFSFLS